MNNYYKGNFFIRTLQRLGNYIKTMKQQRFDAVAGAIGFFVILVITIEYKVFESIYGLTGNLFITASTLLVTAFGGVFSEVVLRRNKDATDDQNMIADAVFYISLVTSAFIGLGAWLQATGLQVINLFLFSVSVAEFPRLSVAVVTLVTLADILLLRAYFRGDVNAVHERNIIKTQSRKKQTDLEIEDALIEFDAQVKMKTERILLIEERRATVRKELNSMYGGKVPDNVMRDAMRMLDDIMKEVQENRDINGDGVIGIAPYQPTRQTVQYANETHQPPKERSENPTQGGRQ